MFDELHLKKACNLGMTFKAIERHCLCCHLIGHIRFFITVRLHVMQRTVLLSQFCLSVCPSDACIVTKLNNALRIF